MTPFKKNDQTTSYPKLSVGILAGGRNTRMGRNKALLKIENERIIERLSKEFSDSPDFSEVLISGAKKGEYEKFGFSVVYDENQKIGPIEGIRRVLTEASSEYVFVCAADMPYITKELVLYLREFISSDYDCYVITDEDHMHPLCAIYKKSILPVVEKAIKDGKYRLFEILGQVRTKYVPLAYSCFDRRVVRNINTREEYRKETGPAVFCVSGFSNSGKTGLIVKLINEFIAQKYQVAVIKHDGCDSFSDRKESDTDRFFKAGAGLVSVCSDTRYAIHARDTIDPKELIGRFKRSRIPPDVVILEGFKASAYPKIEVVRKDVYPKSVCDRSTLICIATDCISPEEVSCPVYGTDDVRGIFLCVKEYFEILDGSLFC